MTIKRKRNIRTNSPKKTKVERLEKRVSELESGQKDLNRALINHKKLLDDMSHALGVQHVKFRIMQRLIQDRFEITDSDFHDLCIKEVDLMNTTSLEEDKKEAPVKTEVFGMTTP